VVASLGFLVPLGTGGADHLVGLTVRALDELSAITGWVETEVDGALELLLLHDWLLLFDLDVLRGLLHATGVGGSDTVAVNEVVL